MIRFYREEKARRYASQLHQYLRRGTSTNAKIEVEIARLKKFLFRQERITPRRRRRRAGYKEFYRSKAKSMDKQIQSLVHRLEKIDREKASRSRGKRRKLSFGSDDPGKRGRRIIEASRIGKRYGELQLFADSSFHLQRGEKIGLVGPNGAGKTTLIETLLG